MAEGKTARQLQLEARVNKYVVRICAGDDQSEAYKASHSKAKRLSNADLISAAKHFADRADVKSALRQAIRSMPVDNILNATEHAKTLLERSKTAFDAGNYTASSAYDRIIAQGSGLVKDNQVINNTWKVGDADLLKQMAGDDPVKQAAVRTLLGQDSFEKPPESDKMGGKLTEAAPDNAVKH